MRIGLLTFSTISTDVYGVFGCDASDDLGLLPGIECHAVLDVSPRSVIQTEDHQTDPSGRSPGYTKGAAGARVPRVDLVVLWDEVHLGQVLEVDGDAWSAIGRQHRGELQLQELIRIPAHFIRPRSGRHVQLFIEEAGIGMIVMEDLRIGRVDGAVDVLHRAPEISSGRLVETEHLALDHDDALVAWCPIHTILSQLVVDVRLLGLGQLLGDLLFVLRELTLGQAIGCRHSGDLGTRDSMSHDDAGNGGTTGDHRRNVLRPNQHDLFLGVEQLDVAGLRIEGIDFLVGDDLRRLEGGASSEDCGGDGSDDTSRGEQRGGIVLSELCNLLLDFSKQLQLSVCLSRTCWAEKEKETPESTGSLSH
jgi:hypothetical protein